MCRKLFARHTQLKRNALTDRIIVDQRLQERMLTFTISYFGILCSTMSFGLEHSPSPIYKCDKTGFDGKKAARERVQLSCNNVGYRTLQLAISADGHYQPPMLIFLLKTYLVALFFCLKP